MRARGMFRDLQITETCFVSTSRREQSRIRVTDGQ